MLIEQIKSGRRLPPCQWNALLYWLFFSLISLNSHLLFNQIKPKFTLSEIFCYFLLLHVTTYWSNYWLALHVISIRVNCHFECFGAKLLNCACIAIVSLIFFLFFQFLAFVECFQTTFLIPQNWQCTENRPYSTLNKFIHLFLSCVSLALRSSPINIWLL